MNDGYYHPGVSQVPIQVNQPDYGSYGGSQSSANANANANANAINGGNGGTSLVGPSSGSYYPVSSRPKTIDNINVVFSNNPILSNVKKPNTNSNANANANAQTSGISSGGVHTIPGKYPTSGIEIIPIDSLPISSDQPVHPTPHRPPSFPQGIGKDETVIPILVVESSPPQYPPQYYRPTPPHRHRPHHHNGKPKQQPIEIIVIEETAPSQGDTSIEYQKSSCVIIDSLGPCINW